jgi:hypothetical protein
MVVEVAVTTSLNRRNISNTLTNLPTLPKPLFQWQKMVKVVGRL